MKHLSWDEAWKVVEDDELDPHSSVLQHLQACEDCALLVERARQSVTMLREGFQLPAAVQARADDDALWAAIRKRIDEEPIPVTKRREWFGYRRTLGQRRMFALLGTGAVAVILVGAALTRNLVLVSHRTTEVEGPIRISGTEAGGPVHTAGPMGGKSLVGANKQAKNATPAKGSASTSSSAMITPEQANSTLSTSGPQPNPFSKTTPATAYQGVLRIHVFVNRANQTAETPLPDAVVAVVTPSGVVSSGTTNRLGDSPDLSVTAPSPGWMSWSGISTSPSVKRHGSATIVVWKTGYQPSVLYNVPIGNGVTPSRIKMTLGTAGIAMPSSRSWPTLSGDLHSLRADLTANTLTSSAPSNQAVASGTTVLRVRTLNPMHDAISNARVAVVSSQDPAHVVMTDASGWSPVMHVQGDTQWGVPEDVWVRAGKPREIILFASKPGVGNWMGQEVLKTGQPSTVNVVLTQGSTAGDSVGTPPKEITQALVTYVVEQFKAR